MEQMHNTDPQGADTQDKLSVHSLPLMNIYDTTSYNEEQIARWWWLIAGWLKSFTAGIRSIRGAQSEAASLKPRLLTIRSFN